MSGLEKMLLLVVGLLLVLVGVAAPGAGVVPLVLALGKGFDQLLGSTH